MTDLTNYQRYVLDCDEDVLLYGGRQIGKTEMVVQGARNALSQGSTVLCVTSTMRMVKELCERVLGQQTHFSNSDIFRVISGHQIETRDMLDMPISMSKLGFDAEYPEYVFVDEATGIDSDIVLGLYHKLDSEMVFTATPLPPSGAGEMDHTADLWAESDDPPVRVVEVPTIAAPFIEYDRFKQIEQSMFDREAQREVWLQR